MHFETSRHRPIALIAVVAALRIAHSVTAEIIHVYEGQSIQAAIDVAADGDEIVVHPGIYDEMIDLLGKAIIVRSSDGPDPTMIHAHDEGTVVSCISGEGPATILEGLTITGGYAGAAGGLLNVSSSPTVTNCVFVSNIASVGGAMTNTHSSPVIIGCSFVENGAYNHGGAIYNEWSAPMVIDCQFTDNGAFVGVGGGVSSIDSAPLLERCTFNANWAIESGGAIHNLTSDITVVNGAFIANESWHISGAVYSGGGNSRMVNCTLSGNVAPDGGGAVYVDAGAIELSNCILWGDSPNEITGPAEVDHSDVEGGHEGVGNIDADPHFAAPASGDYRLSPSSPCIDRGDNAAVPVGVTIDLDGFPRFVDDPAKPDAWSGQPPIVDMGAYEYQADGDLVRTDVVDLLQVLAQWGTSGGGEADVNYDGAVEVLDLLVVLGAWGACP